METVGRRVEFEWQLIKGSPPSSHVSEASLSCQCGPPGPTDSLIKAQSSQYHPLVHSKCDRLRWTRGMQ